LAQHETAAFSAGVYLDGSTAYRPGQSIQFKGFVREEINERLRAPSERTVKWTIERAYAGEVLASGDTKVDTEGGWHGAWTLPEGSPVGDFVVKALIGGQAAGSPARFQIQEFRNLLLRCLRQVRQPRSIVNVQSQYFMVLRMRSLVKGRRLGQRSTDGEYYGDDGWTPRGLFRACATTEFTAETSGEGFLDSSGQVVLRCEAPFKDPGNRAKCHVAWKVDVTGPDGQTITGGTTQDVAMAAVLLGIKRGESRGGEIEFSWEAEELFADGPEAVRVELFRVQTKSVKERLAPNVYRYRSFDQCMNWSSNVSG
jgi:hypothetical protein